MPVTKALLMHSSEKKKVLKYSVHECAVAGRQQCNCGAPVSAIKQLRYLSVIITLSRMII